MKRIATLILALSLAGCATVPAGHVGVPTHFGAVGDSAMDEGIHGIVPIMTTVHKVDVRIQKLTIDASATSSDLQTVTSTVALNYRVDAGNALDLFQDIGMAYEDTVITPYLQEAIKTITAQYTAEQLISSRPEVKERILSQIREGLVKSHIIVTDLSVENFQFSDAYDQAIERKQVAEQAAQQAQNDLDRIRIEAEQKEAQAEGEAAAMLAKAEAEAEALRLQRSVLTPELLQLRWIEKWDGTVPQTQLGESGTLYSVK
ncbi:MAG: prohibitin family protein [Candidatus Thorarchaeota archaeon]|jgi:regulator of protease activity HflC (stomatin/prohibitin superfamily)